MSRPLRFQDGPFTAARHRQSRKWPHGHVPVFSQFSQHKGAGPRAGEGQGPRAPLLGPGWAPWGSQPSPGDPRPTAAAPGLDTPGRGSHRIRELGLNPPGGGACPLQERRQGGPGAGEDSATAATVSGTPAGLPRTSGGPGGHGLCKSVQIWVPDSRPISQSDHLGGGGGPLSLSSLWAAPGFDLPVLK